MSYRSNDFVKVSSYCGSLCRHEADICDKSVTLFLLCLFLHQNKTSFRVQGLSAGWMSPKMCIAVTVTKLTGSVLYMFCKSRRHLALKFKHLRNKSCTFFSCRLLICLGSAVEWVTQPVYKYSNATLNRWNSERAVLDALARSSFA